MYERGQISHVQLGLLIFVYLSGFSTLYLLEVKVVENNAWISYLFTLILTIFIIWMLSYVQNHHLNKNLFQICEELLGKWGAKIIFLLYMYYSFELGSLATKALSVFFVTVIIPDTPSIVLTFFVIMVTSYAVFLGIEVIVRTVQVILPFFILLITMISFLIYREVITNPFLPLFSGKVTDIIYGSMLSMAFPFGKVVLFGLIFAFVKKKEKIFISSCIALVLSSIYITITTYLTLGSLGINLTKISSFPFFSAIQLVKIGEYIERLEIVIIGIWTIYVLFEIIIVHYFFVMTLGHLCSLKDIKPFIIPVGLLLLGLTERSYRHGGTDIAQYDYEILPISSLIPVVIIPIFLTICTWVKANLPTR